MEHRFEIRHVPLWPAVRVAFILFLVIGILFAILYAVIITGMGFLAGTLGESAFGEDLGLMKNLGFVMIPIIAILYAVFGTITAVIWILLYNLIASVVGGVELNLKPKVGHTVEREERPIQVAGPNEEPVSNNKTEG